jgi:hypothetical protein
LRRSVRLRLDARRGRRFLHVSVLLLAPAIGGLQLGLDCFLPLPPPPRLVVELVPLALGGLHTTEVALPHVFREIADSQCGPPCTLLGVDFGVGVGDSDAGTTRTGPPPPPPSLSCNDKKSLLVPPLAVFLGELAKLLHAGSSGGGNLTVLHVRFQGAGVGCGGCKVGKVGTGVFFIGFIGFFIGGGISIGGGNSIGIGIGV